MSRPRTWITLAALLCLAITGGAQKAKKVIYVEDDGFPSGHDTPEGAAADLARSFIKFDDKLFRATCIRPFGGGGAKDPYVKFLKQKVHEIRAEAKKKTHSKFGPASLAKLYAAQLMGEGGGASLGYAAYYFQELMFVDTVITRIDGESQSTRLMVIQDRDRKWYVFPDPSADPLLSGGLNDEKHVEKDFSEAYTVKHRPKNVPKQK